MPFRCFPSIVFRLGLIAINRKSGIKTPKDLEGKRVGVPLYTQTAAIFINGMLQHEYGVDLSKIHWVQSAMNTAGSHGSPTVLPLLKNVSIENNQTGKTLGRLLADGDIDATLGTSLPDEIRNIPTSCGCFPITSSATSIFTGARTSIRSCTSSPSRRASMSAIRSSRRASTMRSSNRREIALDKLFNLRAVRYMTPFLMREIDDIWDVFNGDPWPYGVEPNRQTLEALVTYQQDLGLIAAPVKVDDLFVPTYG